MFSVPIGATGSEKSMSNSSCTCFLGDGGRPLRGLACRNAFRGGIGFGGDSGIDGFKMDLIKGNEAWEGVSATMY